MVKTILVSILGLLLGLSIGYVLLSDVKVSSTGSSINLPLITNAKPVKREVIGFLPYWLITNAQGDYSKYITTLTYFGLTVGTDGTIQKYTNPREFEPGWYTLDSGKLDPIFESAKKDKVNLSLLLFSGNNSAIAKTIENPEVSAQNLVNDVAPVMQKYGFKDLNLDIENVSVASDDARLKMQRFVGEVRNQMNSKNLGTLSIELIATDFVKKDLIDPVAIAPLVDKIIIMGYDYHHPGSFVTGPVAPLYGAGTESEYDVETAVQKAMAIIPPEKIILGIPLYGYEWETLGDFPRAAVIPGSGITASSVRAQDIMTSCMNCSTKEDKTAKESYIIYKDKITGSYHQIFFPDKAATKAKVDFVSQTKIGGLALWALGYEADDILSPLSSYLNSK